MSQRPLRARVSTWRAVFQGPEARAALAPALEALAQGAPPAGAELVKRSRVRAVWRLPLPEGGSAYLKRYASGALADRLRARLGASRAAREWRNLRRLRGLGVPCVEPLLWAEGPGGVGLVATRGVEGAVPLRHRIASESPAAAADWLAAAARIARRLHDGGLWHRDLHAGNVLAAGAAPPAAGGRALLVDVQKLRALPFALPRRLRARDLAPLLGVEEHAAQTAQPEPLARVYATCAEPQLDPEALARALRRAQARLARVRLRSRGRRCVVPSTGFRIETSGATRIYRRADVPEETVRAALEAQRRGAASPARGDAAARRRLRLDDALGGPVPGPAPSLRARGQGAAEPGAPARAPLALVASRRRRLRAFLGRGAGMAAWRAAHALLLRGIDTPAPLALVVERGPGCSVRELYLSRWEVGMEDALSFLRAAPPGRARAGALRSAGAWLAALHAAGVRGVTGDPAALLVAREPVAAGDAPGRAAAAGARSAAKAAPAAHPGGAPGRRFAVLDPAAARFGRPPGRRARRRELARLAQRAVAAQPALGVRELARFVAGYAHAAGLSQAQRRALLGELARATRGRRAPHHGA